MADVDMMMKCPVCDLELKEGSVCPRCGTNVPPFASSPDRIDIKDVDHPLVDMQCERCEKGIMVLVTDETDIPRYRCPECKAYKGEFLHTGKEIYYSTTELRVGQFIDTKLRIVGHLFLPADDHMEYLARKISEATKIEPERIESAVQYLTERNVIMIIPKGDHFEVEFR
jgi:hypothetical protein